MVSDTAYLSTTEVWHPAMRLVGAFCSTQISLLDAWLLTYQTRVKCFIDSTGYCSVELGTDK